MDLPAHITASARHARSTNRKTDQRLEDFDRNGGFDMRGLVGAKSRAQGISLQPVPRYGVKICDSVESGFASGRGRATEAAHGFKTIEHGKQFHAHRAQVAQLLLDLLQSSPAKFGDLSEFGGAAAIDGKSRGRPVQTKKLLDFLKREAQFLAATNDA